MTEDKPPTYSEAMAAITAGLRRQGIRTPESTNTDRVVSNNSDIVVVLPSRVRQGHHAPDVPSEPPPAYTDPVIPTAPPDENNQRGDQTSHPSGGSKPPPYSNSNSKQDHNIPDRSLDEQIAKANLPTQIQRPHPSAPPMYPGHAQWMPSAPERPSVSDKVPSSNGFKRSSSTEKKPIRDEKSSDMFDDRPESEEEDFDPSSPGPVKLDQREYKLTSDSPSCSDIKWTPPPNASDFSGLVYAIQLDSLSNPILTRSPKSKSSFDVTTWLEIMDTARPSLRVFLSSSTLTIGPAKWKLSALGSNPLVVRLRLRAVADLNSLPSCKCGPWSKPITLVFTEDTMMDALPQLKRMLKYR